MAQTYRNIFFGPARPGYKSDQVGIAWKVRQDGSRIVKLHVGEAASESYGWSEALAYLGPATARHGRGGSDPCCGYGRSRKTWDARSINIVEIRFARVDLS